jgi:hypothetical protein
MFEQFENMVGKVNEKAVIFEVDGRHKATFYPGELKVSKVLNDRIIF